MLPRLCTVALRVPWSQAPLRATMNPHRLTQGNLLERFYSSNEPPAIGIVDYDYVKKLPCEPQKLLIDVREPKELKETGQIPTSINIRLALLCEELATSKPIFECKYGREKPQLDTEIIFHCRSGKRSLEAAEATVALGFRNVRSYEGSWLDWAKREGLPE